MKKKEMVITYEITPEERKATYDAMEVLRVLEYRMDDDTDLVVHPTSYSSFVRAFNKKEVRDLRMLLGQIRDSERLVIKMREPKE